MTFGLLACSALLTEGFQARYLDLCIKASLILHLLDWTLISDSLNNASWLCPVTTSDIVSGITFPHYPIAPLLFSHNSRDPSREDPVYSCSLTSSWESLVPLLRVSASPWWSGLDEVKCAGASWKWSVSLPRTESLSGLFASSGHSNWQTGSVSPLASGSHLPPVGLHMWLCFNF